MAKKIDNPEEPTTIQFGERTVSLDALKPTAEQIFELIRLIGKIRAKDSFLFAYPQKPDETNEDYKNRLAQAQSDDTIFNREGETDEDRMMRTLAPSVKGVELALPVINKLLEFQHEGPLSKEDYNQVSFEETCNFLHKHLTRWRVYVGEFDYKS